MKTIALRTNEGRFIAHEVRIACSFSAQVVGLARARSLPTRAGLLLNAAYAVHTLGMRFAIDIVFLSRQMRVLGLAPAVPPWRVLLAPRGTGRVLELAAGQIAATGLKTGAFLLVETSRPQCERSPIRFSLRLPQHYEDATQEVSASSSRSLPRSR
jgi:uncharacterized protein